MIISVIKYSVIFNIAIIFLSNIYTLAADEWIPVTGRCIEDFYDKLPQLIINKNCSIDEKKSLQFLSSKYGGEVEYEFQQLYGYANGVFSPHKKLCLANNTTINEELLLKSVYLRKYDNLQLTISNGVIYQDFVEYFEKCPHVSKLIFENCRFSGNVIISEKFFQHLKILKISNTNMILQTYPINLFSSLECSNIEVLHLENVTESNIKSICKIPSLKALHLSWITNQEIQYLPHCQKLEILVLEYSMLSNFAGQKLKAISSLNCLKLKDNVIGNGFFMELQNSNIEQLNYRDGKFNFPIDEFTQIMKIKKLKIFGFNHEQYIENYGILKFRVLENNHIRIVGYLANDNFAEFSRIFSNQSTR